MRSPVVRFFLALVLAEAVPVIVLVAIVAVFGPREAAGANAFARQAGPWVGTIGGFVCALAGARWVGAAAASRALAWGTGLGLALAAVDVGVFLAMREPFAWIIAISNAGKVVAGAIGGLLAARAPGR